ncbi:hypothetical protein GCM10023080_071990 [Streptomyces pseudoechinosporeus]
MQTNDAIPAAAAKRELPRLSHPCRPTAKPLICSITLRPLQADTHRLADSIR